MQLSVGQPAACAAQLGGRRLVAREERAMAIIPSTHGLRSAAVVVGVAALAGGAVPRGLGAQDWHASRGLAVVAGPANYDLSGTGWSWAAAARLDMPLARVLLLEPGLGFFTYS